MSDRWWWRRVGMKAATIRANTTAQAPKTKGGPGMSDFYTWRQDEASGPECARDKRRRAFTSELGFPATGCMSFSSTLKKEKMKP